MVETVTGNRAASSFGVQGARGSGNVKAAYGQHTFASGDDQDGDIFQLCRIPANSRVIGGWLYGDDLDTGGSEALDFDLGWAANGTESADADGLGNFGLSAGDAVVDIKPEVGIYYPLGGKMFTEGTLTFSAETIIQLEVNTPANSLTPGPLFVVILYVENDGVI